MCAGYRHRLPIPTRRARSRTGQRLAVGSRAPSATRVAGRITSYDVDRKVDDTRTADSTDPTLIWPV
jgi:hypothetical protein